MECVSGPCSQGFRGAPAAVADVRLVLVSAEPGDPFDGESYATDGTPQDYLRSVCVSNADHLRHSSDQYMRNLRRILDMAWPGADLQEQLRKTWVTNSVLCSAPVESGKVPRHIEQHCITRH